MLRLRREKGKGGDGKTEPPTVAGGAAACFAAAFSTVLAALLTGVGHSAITAPPPTGGGSVRVFRRSLSIVRGSEWVNQQPTRDTHPLPRTVLTLRTYRYRHLLAFP